MKFKINGKSLAAEVSSPCVERVSKYLDKLAFEELLDSATLAANVGYSVHHVQNAVAQRPELKKYTAMSKTRSAPKRVWGNKRTIRAFRKDKELCVHEA